MPLVRRPETEREEEADDSRGIPGWERVDKLARTLVELHGLSVMHSQAAEIQELYHKLPEFDKKPLVVVVLCSIVTFLH